MYRYTVDNAVTYTSEDFVLFRESPFACWMERLTLENPDHGIPPDVDSQAPQNSMQRQDDVADTLRAEGRKVTLVDWDQDEAGRRRATVQAMHSGVDFIVNGQLALGPLSGSANLLMRTSGYSELGDFLYIPCDTQARTTLHSAFRLCFLADLLHSLQGQLPPQLLIIRGSADLVPLQTEDHIYHYRAVKQRFMEAMRSFRKHRMPDPAESSHFGRWSDCANEVLKQRALREERPADDLDLLDSVAMPQLAAAAGPLGSSAYDLDDNPGAMWARPGQHPAPGASVAVTSSEPMGGTGGRERSDPAKEDLENPAPGTVQRDIPGLDSRGLFRRESDRKGSDVALQNLQFIGSSDLDPLNDPDGSPGRPEAVPGVETPATFLKPHPLDSAGFSINAGSVADLDTDPVGSPDIVLGPAGAGSVQRNTFGRLEDGATSLGLEPVDDEQAEIPALLRSFSDSLITSEPYQD